MMIFTMDIGNTNIKTALFCGDTLLHYWRVSTNRTYTSDEYGIILEGMFRHADLSMNVVEGIMISSVVPTINFTIDHMCRINGRSRVRHTRHQTGINILYESPRDLGSDRICNAVAAYTLWHALHLH